MDTKLKVTLKPIPHQFIHLPRDQRQSQRDGKPRNRNHKKKQEENKIMVAYLDIINMSLKTVLITFINSAAEEKKMLKKQKVAFAYAITFTIQCKHSVN